MAMYRHRQVGRKLIVATVFGFLVSIWVVATLSPETREATPWVLWALFGLLTLALALFATLTVEVDNDEIRVAFGIGLIRRSIAVADVLRCDIIRTRLWWGVGLRWTPSGWLYNVGGREAVRLELAQQRAVMIGSNDAAALKGAIDGRLAARERIPTKER